MKMSKKTGIVFVFTGAVLILSALLLYFYNVHEDERAGRVSSDILCSIKAEITQTELPSNSPASEYVESVTLPAEVPSEAMPVVSIGGYEYIGYISIPKLNLELPIMNDWSYMKLDMAPCRHSGSTVTDDLVIAAHNYMNHFANLSLLKVGDSVSITKMDGDKISYVVEEQRIVDGKAVEEVLVNEYDLALYTCTYEGTTRIVVFCNRI